MRLGDLGGDARTRLQFSGMNLDDARRAPETVSRDALVRELGAMPAAAEQLLTDAGLRARSNAIGRAQLATFAAAGAVEEAARRWSGGMDSTK